MSQLVVRPGRNAAREAKRLKDVRKVKGAILWHERERAKRQKLFQERFESKQAVLQRIKWESQHVTKLRKEALAKAKEDWQLGPLRPNRAVGQGADTYGALSGKQTQKPDIPVHTQKNRNETRAKRGLEPEYPLVVDDKKYFHLAKDDRVVVIKGREKGKIGIVRGIVQSTHEVIVKGVNMQYHDATTFNSSEESAAKRMNEVPIPIADVRLVVPYEITEKKTVYKHGQEVEVPVKYFTDVIVDKIVMERHITGIDPFTGTDFGDAEIPKDHQYDPQSGLPIFHRYIAGTRERIEWPWEKEEEIEESSIAEDPKAEKQSWIRKTLGTLRHPIQSVKSWTSSKDTASVTAAKESEEKLSDKLSEIEQQVRTLHRTSAPKSKDPAFSTAYYDADTTRNIVEGAENMSYTLLSPPYPPTLSNELRTHIQHFTAQSRNSKHESTPSVSKKPKHKTQRGAIASEIAKAKRDAANRMKTPMQLRWEAERAKKLKSNRGTPLVSTEELVSKLQGYRRERKGVKIGEVE